MQKGILTTWKDDRGFGFIQSSSSNQKIFLHITAVKENSRRPLVGDVVYYQLERDEQGRLRASSAWIENAVQQPIHAPKISNSKSPKPVQSSILPALLLSTLPIWGALDFAFRTRNVLPLLAYPTVSFFTVIAYADDKQRAMSRQWRISERSLHLLELFGGWIGAFVAQQKFRHKTRKASYQFVFLSIVALHLVFWFDWLFLGGNFAQIFNIFK